MGSESEGNGGNKHDHSTAPSTSNDTTCKDEDRRITQSDNRKSPSSRCSSRSKTSCTPPEAAGIPQEEKIPMKLASPVGGEAFTFYWPLREVQGYSEGQEILDVVRNALASFPEVNFILRQNYDVDAVDKRSYEQMSGLLEAWNKTVPTITQLWKGATKPGSEIWSSERADANLLKLICARAYNRAVDNVNLLNNHYKAFSSETYGETSFERLQMIIQEITPKERDVFVDLGSGVGQLVIQMAGGSRIRKAVGIEIASLPNRYAQNLMTEFKKWMKWYGKKFRPFELHKGDFLDQRFRDLITKEATIIFINNYAFTADLETRIKRELLFDLKDGTRIISTKPYGLTNRTITDRQLNDISSILDVSELKQCENACSWTSNYVPYYLHKVNRAKLETYFLSQRNPSLKVASNGSDGSRRSSTSSSKASRESLRCWSRESSVSLPIRSNTPTRHCTTPTLARSRTPNVHSRVPTPPAKNANISNINHSDDDDEPARGPTTRRKWQEYCSTKSKNEKAHAVVAAAANENDPGDAVTKWPTPDTDYIPPSAKKPRKTGAGRGRPRKIPVVPKPAIASDTKETINLMHQMTCTATARPTSPLHDPSLVLADLSSPTFSTASSSATHPGLPVEGLQPSKYPALNQLLDSMRIMYESQLDSMRSNNNGYAEALRMQIQVQTEIRESLLHRMEGVTRHISQLLANGVVRLQARLDELGIDAPSPAILLDNAKEIVAHHKKITAECAALESEITALDLSNQQLEMKVRRRDDASGASVASATNLTSATSGPLLSSIYGTNALAEKYQALESHKNVFSKFTAKLESMPSGDVTHQQESLLSPKSDMSGGATFTQAAPTMTQHSVQALTPNAGNSNALKRARHRGARGGPSSKRLPSSAVKSVSDPKEDEEMERKIQDIVAKALEVDSAAKCAEKERRARGDKRKDKGPSTAVFDSGGRRAEDSVLASSSVGTTAVSGAMEGVVAPHAVILSPGTSCEGGPVLVPTALLVKTPETDSARSDED